MAMKYIKLFEGWKLMEGEDDIDAFVSSSPKKFPVLNTTIGNYIEAVEDDKADLLIQSLLQRSKQDLGSTEFNKDAGKDVKLQNIRIEKKFSYSELLDKGLHSAMNKIFGKDFDINQLDKIGKKLGFAESGGYVYKVKEGDCVLFFKDPFENGGDPEKPITELPIKGVVLVQNEQLEFPAGEKTIAFGQLLAFVNQGVSMDNMAILDPKMKDKGIKKCEQIFAGEGLSSLGKFAQTVKIGGQDLQLANGVNGTIIPLYVAKDVMGTCGFDFNKATLKEDAKDTLSKKELWSILTKAQNSIEIIGHTDSIGKEEVNMTLSKQRAESVLKFLQGMDGFKTITQKKIKVTTTGMGFKEMVVDDKGGKDKDAAAKNRRVVIKVDGVGPDYKKLIK